MDSERYQQIKRVFTEAAAQQGPARETFLDRACAGDDELRAEVERLLEAASVATGDFAPVLEPEPPERCGPYRIEREIGQGGMGVVYEAIDERDGERVALKVMHPLLRAGGRLRREAQLGLAIDHPHLVRTLDWGESEGHAYIAMEFVEGRTLREMAGESGTLPEALLREIAAQVADGLEAMHRAGIVHRDLKPENLIITDDQRVRIMDFGIAKVLEATVELTKPGQFIGSLRYASPEQCAGTVVGPVSDLYSLGVVLYELATGHNPFRRENPAAALVAHREEIPPPARVRAPALSPFFSDLLDALLAKEPGERVAGAAELRAILREGESGSWWRPSRAPKPEIFVRRDTALHGRAAELQRLDAAWDAAREGSGGSLLLVGEAGLGKTRLIDEFVRGIEDDAHLLYGSFPPTGGMEGLCEAVAGLFRDEALETALRPHLAPSLIEPFASFLRGVPMPLKSELLRSAFCQLLESLARSKPVLWICDDLHFAPEAARPIVRALARAAEGHPALLLASSRERRSGFPLLELQRLEQPDVDRIVRELRPTGNDRMAAAAHGVPYFILEIARAPEDARVPEAVRDLIGARLARLARSERTALDVAAIQGAEFDAGLIAQALSLPLVAVLQDLAEVERRDGLIRAVGRRFAFDHHLVREAVYEQIPELLRAEYHGLLARAIDGPAAALARHHLHSRTPEEGLPLLDEALDELERGFLDEEALELVERALPICDDAARARLMLRKTSLHDRAGDRAAQRATAEAVRDLADRLGDPALQAAARRGLARLFATIGREHDALDQYRAAREFAHRAGDLLAEARTLNLLGVSLQNIGRLAAALEVLEEARTLARRIPDDAADVVAITTIATIHRRQGRYDESLRLFEEALALDADHPHDRDYLQFGHAQLLYYLGRFEEARALMEQHVRSAIASGDRRRQAVGLASLGLLQMDVGDLADSLESLGRTFRLQLEIEGRRGVTIAQLNLGELHNLLGDYEQAAGFLEAARESSGDEAMRHVLGSVHDALGRLHEWSGGSGEEDFARAAELHRAVGDPEREARSRLRLGQIDRTIAIADEHGYVGVRALAAAHAHDLATATDLLAREGRRMDCWYRLETTWLVGRTEEARAMLDNIVARAPESHRERMVREVPLFRAILDATGSRPDS